MSQSVAIIPARGGSKRIPRKNIKLFAGKPIIEYSIRAALESGCFDEVMVSTDDPEIAEVARKAGASIPFMRSEKNADDYAGTTDVLKEVILAYREQGKSFDYLCCLYPTAPFVSAARLKEAMQKLRDNNAECVLPIVRFGYPIQRSLKIEDGKAKMVWPENYFARSQDLEPIYHDCGQFYCMRTDAMLSQMKLYTENTLPIILPESEVQDIDTEEDWEIAELKYRLLYPQKINS